MTGVRLIVFEDESRLLSANHPIVHLFGVAHYDPTLEERVLKRGSESLTDVYHESPKSESVAGFLLYFLAHPTFFVPLVFRKVTDKWTPNSECRKAAEKLADLYDADLHFIEAPRGERAKDVFGLATIFGWIHIWFLVRGVSWGYSVTGIDGAFWVVAILGFFAIPHGHLWNRLEFRVREARMVENILKDLPEEGSTGMAIIGDSHRKSIEKLLDGVDTHSESLVEE